MLEELLQAIYNFDHSVLLFIQENLRFEHLTPVMRFFSITVNKGVLWILLGAVLLCFKRTRMIGAVVLSSLLVGLMINNVIVKNIFDRTRPYDFYSDLIPLIKKPKDSSFASGHTTASFAAAGAAVRFFNKPISAAVLCYAFLVAASRLYLGVHYPTDVIVGAAIGTASSLLVFYLYQKKFDLEPYKLKAHRERN